MEKRITTVKTSVIYTALLIILGGCGGTQEMVVAPPITYEEEILDTMTVTATPLVVSEPEVVIPEFLDPYNPSATRRMDILHTDLNLRFDWINQYVIGQATISVTPIFYDQDNIVLDAKGFDINAVKINGSPAEYKYNGSQLDIQFANTAKRGDKLLIYIDYVAKPNELEEGGSAAITSDKGLFFIDPLDEDAEKPSQVWTQGETENNSRWFPTFDKPNERTTQKVTLRVQKKYATLSNGVLTSSILNDDGTRTDVWEMKDPHAPYLFMLAIGEYAVVKEKWKGLEIGYYVEPAYEAYAKNIFAHTPEMLTFFSELLDYPYPWDKYSQVICRDYVSGAMENTTAVIFGEFVQKTDQELIDNDNDYIVAHEMFHHWFGDLVTCESWANLTLQEGFANYSEYLWFEHKYGEERAESHRASEIQGYLLSAANQGTHPLIHYGYEDKEDMFDAHSYNKGGLVLHMLRDYVGDEAFFASLNKYLVDNAYTAVEVDELRMAFEDTIGEDLQWFFDQWYLSEGHPTIEYTHQYDPAERTTIIEINQTQDIENHLPIYELVVEMHLIDSMGNVSKIPALLNQRNQVIEIADTDKPHVVLLDGKNTQLAVIDYKRNKSQYLTQFRYADNFMYKQNAAEALKNSVYFQAIQGDLLSSNYYNLRKIGVANTSLGKNKDKYPLLEKMAKNDIHSSVRKAALKKIADFDFAKAKPTIEEILSKKEAYPVIAEALRSLKYNDKSMALAQAKMYENQSSVAMIQVISEIYAESGDKAYLTYFEDKLGSVSLYAMFGFYNKYAELLRKMDKDTKIESASKLHKIGLENGNMFRRFMAVSTLNKIVNSFSTEETAAKIQVENLMNEAIKEEKNEQLKMRYQGF